jgi:hypothetical protein
LDSRPELPQRYRLDKTTTVQQGALHFGVTLTSIANMQADDSGEWVRWADVQKQQECPRCERYRQWVIELIKEIKFDEHGNPV